MSSFFDDCHIFSDHWEETAAVRHDLQMTHEGETHQFVLHWYLVENNFWSHSVIPLAPRHAQQSDLMCLKRSSTTLARASERSRPCPESRTTSLSSIPPKPPPRSSISFHYQKDRREGRWCVTDARFRLSVREINIDTVCFLPGAWCRVCVGLWFHYPLLSHFFLKNQTITDVLTEIETPCRRGLSEQVILPGGSTIAVKCKPPKDANRKETLRFHQLL